MTEADRAAEVAMRRMIEAMFPAHGIIGEEFGSVRETAEYVWVLDPIDGTRAFIAAPVRPCEGLAHCIHPHLSLPSLVQESYSVSGGQLNGRFEGQGVGCADVGTPHNCGGGGDHWEWGAQLGPQTLSSRALHKLTFHHARGREGPLGVGGTARRNGVRTHCHQPAASREGRSPANGESLFRNQGDGSDSDQGDRNASNQGDGNDSEEEGRGVRASTATRRQRSLHSSPSLPPYCNTI